MSTNSWQARFALMDCAFGPIADDIPELMDSPLRTWHGETLEAYNTPWRNRQLFFGYFQRAYLCNHNFRVRRVGSTDDIVEDLTVRAATKWGDLAAKLVHHRFRPKLHHCFRQAMARRFNCASYDLPQIH